MRRTLLCTLVALTATLGCESSPKPKKSSAPSTDEGKRELNPPLEKERLLQEVQLHRDREFTDPPDIVAVDRETFATPTPCVDACRDERDLLVRVFFGGKEPRLTPHTFSARYEAAENTVQRANTADPWHLRSDVIAELVRALEKQTLPALPTADSWDEHLARSAIRQGTGRFVAQIVADSRLSRPMGAAEIAKRPDGAGDPDFAQREGLGLAAAMYRAGGWSAVELLRHEPPSSSMYVVRPDRYLDGTALGSWTWPSSATQSRADSGWSQAGEGRVGPAVFVGWLSQHIEPQVARFAYLGWESDRYRVWERDDRWVWEYVSLWNTPHTAQQIVEALDAGLRRQSPDGQYTVLRKGTTVVVVGSNRTLDAESLDLATELVEMRPVFQQNRPKGLAFVPTPVDRLQARETGGLTQASSWTDSATGITVDLSPLGDGWTVMTTASNVTLPWFAKHDDGTIIEYTTVVDESPIPFAAEKRRELLVHDFESDIDVDTEIAAERSEVPAADTIVLTLQGSPGDSDGLPLRKIKVWTFEVGDYVVAVSLQAPPAAFATREKTATALVESLEVPTPGDDEKGKGVIEFRVE